MFYSLSILTMPKPTTEWSGAEPEKLDFNAEAEKIIQEMSGEAPKEDPKKDDKGDNPDDKKAPGEDPKKSEDGEWKPKGKEEPQTPKEDELKIPRSRLNKEIEKKTAIQSKYDKLMEKVKVEEDRLNSLSDDEKEEQENLKKLWMDTKLSKLQDRLEEMQDDMSDKDNQIKDLQETIKKSETGALSKRITELTKKKDWKDWLPKFDIKELLEFSKEKNFLPNDPIELYNFKYQAEIYAKKYEKTGVDIDKWNKENFTPSDKKPTFADWDQDFEDEAKRIIESLGQTT